MGFWPGGFDAWKGRWKNRKRWDRAHETQPRPWSTSPEAGTRPRRRRGVGPRPAPTASHHLPRGGMGGTCDPSPRVHKREPRSQQHRWTVRGPAPSRRSITGHGAQKADAHKLCAHPLARRPRVLVGASARSQRAHIAHPWTGKRCRITLGPPSGGACSRRARSGGDGAACWQLFGANQRAIPTGDGEPRGGLGAC